MSGRIPTNNRRRYAVLTLAVVVIVGGVAFLAARDSAPARQQGLVGPKGPPPPQTPAPRQ